MKRLTKSVERGEISGHRLNNKKDPGRDLFRGAVCKRPDQLIVTEF